MTLQLDVKYLEGLSGKGDRIIRAKFRGNEKSTPSTRGQNSCYFGVELVWKVARRLTETDNIVITAYDQSKYLPKKPIGSVTVNLTELIKKQALNLEEFLVDSNKMVTNVSLSFDLYYRPPDKGEEGLDSEKFDQPFADLHKAGKSSDEYEDEEVAEEEFEGDSNFAELFDMQAAGTGVDMGDIQSEHSSVLSAPIRRDPKLKPLTEATVLKPETFTVSVTIIEARNLPGTNINPIVTVTANGRTQKTDVKLYTNTPYYNKFFPFEYYMPRPAVMDEIIRIKVFSLRSQVIARILPGKFIGEFLIDVRTIYESKGHALNNKWAVLIDPKNPLQGPVGYVRLDLAFLGKDEIPKHIKREKAADDENIEKDLLVPKGITNLMKRNITEFAVKLYRAEGLPPMNTDIITSIKQAFVGEGAPMCDPYVEVSFGGHSGKTKVKKYTYNPIWNQEIVFADFFPPLTHSIRLTVKDWDTLKDEEIATHIIDLKQLFNASTPNQLPSFGPSWVNLYGTPRTYTYEQMKRPHDELNRNLGEGVAFRGRLLMTIQAKPSVETMKTGAFSKATPAVSELVAGKKSPYFLFVAFYGISAVDLEIGRDKTPIQFEVSIGTYGNKIDGKKGGIHVPQVQPPRKDDTREKLDWNESLSAPFNLTTDSGAYYHVEFQGAQPCLYLLCEFEDHRLRMCIPNILEKLRDEYAYAISQVQHLIRRRKQGSARHRLRQILLYKSRLFGEAAGAACKCRGTAPKTPLDVSYQVRVRSDLLRIEKRMQIIGKRLTNANMNEALREARAAIVRVTELINCPQHALPDIFISMVRNNQRIGFLRIPARDAYYSVSDAERGKYNSLVTTHSVRKPGHEGAGEKGWRIQCQVQVYMWLGLLKDYRAYKSGLPLGFDEQCFADLNPPRSLIYKESSVFELRCYLFMARNLLASNSTGFSDPIARVLLENVLLETFVIHDTMSPMWDLTLIKSSVTFCHRPEGVKMNPPQVIVEFFDIDGSEEKSKQGYVKSSSLNYLGRCFCEPQVTIKGDNYIAPPLQWWQIYRGQTQGGKLLACFDLIQSDALDDSPDIPSHDDLLDFTRRFNEHILLGPTCGIPFSDEEDEEEEVETEDMEVGTTARFEDEMIKANRLLDDEAMANLTAPLDDVMSTADARSVVSAASASTARRAARRKKQQQGGTVKYGLATPDLVRWRAETDLRVPETIRPPLGRFRLEVVFWGVRELRRQFLLPVNRPIITVEVGGTRVVSDLMQNAKVNPLFEHHLKYVDLNLPLDDQYWPPITIMCHDYRMFGVRITVGLCTLPVATDFFEKTALVVEDEHAECSPIESDHEEKAVQGVLAKALTGFKADEDPEDAEKKDEEADQLAGGGFGPLRPQPTGGISSEESSEEDDSEKDTTEGEKQEEKMTAASTLTSESGTNFASHPANYTESDPILTADKSKPSTVSYVGRQGGFTPPGQVQQFQVNPMLKISKDLFSNLDWWSRLYATLNSMDDIDESSGDEDSTEEPDLFDEKLLQIEVSDNKAELEQGLLEVSEDELAPKPLSRKNRIRKFFRLKPKKELTALEKYEKKKAKERRKKKKKKKGEPSFVRKLRGDAKKAFDKELKESFYVTEEAELDETFIEKLEIYAMDLEEVPAFSGFTSPIRNFCLYRGKQDDDDVTAEERAVGYFKGNLMLYPVGEDEPLPQSVKDLKCFPTLPQTEYANVLVRVYIVRGFNLRPSDPSGTSDPFLVVSLGKQVFNEKDSYLKKTLRPTFGKMFQFDAKFPMDTTLHVQVFDHDIFGSNDLIGETVIDLEARYHSPHRPRCGLIKNFYSHGYAQWRDTQLPTKLLEDLCEQYGLPKPVYTQIENCVTVGQQKFFADSTIVDETGEKKKSNEPLALAALNNFEQLVPGNQLVPEHVEMRKLLHPEKGSLEQGRLMMWIDMFDKDLGRPPEPVDITPRTPEKWELRVIIHNTSDVVLNDTSLFSNERSSDIYVRGWLKGVGYDDQQTDVHYRSLSGEGNFNWRFVFPFDYVKQEDQITYQVKGPFDLESAEVKVPCELSLQVWDAEMVRSDKFLGSNKLRLRRMPRPAKTPETCGLHQLDKDCQQISLFANKTIRGWWPLVIMDDEEGELVVQGKVEAELQLVPGLDAENAPVGKGREDPDGLPPPNRPDSSFMSFMGPMNTIRYLIKYKLKWLLIKLLIAFLLILIVFLLIYTSPGWITKKIWNA
ncbi:hypothetical protein AAHC03_026054 [Spirometra sp. Aus1]